MNASNMHTSKLDKFTVLDTVFKLDLGLLWDLKVIHWFCTAHKKMAAVKKSIRSNPIKMKSTEEKRYWNICLRFFLAEVRLNVLGMCIT